MGKINPNASSLIDAYIESKESFSKEICEVLRTLIHKSNNDVVEDWKWNIPIFQKNEMVCGFAGFKKHVSLTFFNGAQLSDHHKLFADDCGGQNSRTIKFMSIEDINEGQVFEYLKAAFLLSEAGVKKNTTPKKEVIVPELLQNALNENKLAKQNFEGMAYTYRKEYAQHIADAKRESTKLNRLKKVIDNLEKNIKMHEQYKC